ncbi:MAG: hypothetical protein KDC38_12880 [Planctomycetes bacterium]|nr:hypothetical protein [Planctomycetota bacterium]
MARSRARASSRGFDHQLQLPFTANSDGCADDRRVIESNGSSPMPDESPTTHRSHLSPAVRRFSWASAPVPGSAHGALGSSDIVDTGHFDRDAPRRGPSRAERLDLRSRVREGVGTLRQYWVARRHGFSSIEEHRAFVARARAFIHSPRRDGADAAPRLDETLCLQPSVMADEGLSGLFVTVGLIVAVLGVAFFIA